MTHHLRAVLSLVAVLVAGCTAGPPPEPPFGLDPGVLTASSVTSSMRIVSGEDTTSLGTATTEVIPGDQVVLLVLTQDLRQGTMSDTLVVDAGTLLPIRYMNQFPGLQAIETVYEPGGRVHSEVVRGDQVTGIDTVLAGPYLDAGSFTSLLPALPLADGYTAEIPVVHYESGATTQSVRVSGSYVVTYHGSRRPVWLVEVDGGAGVVTHAVDKEARIILRTTLDLPNGWRFEQVALD